MRFVFDTNIVLFYLRQHPITSLIEEKFNPFESSNEVILSAVSLGELKAIAKMNNWGKSKIKKLEQLCNQFIITGINSEDVIERYAEIDAFSQGKLKEKVSNFTSRNMGKNDLWIAATASILNAKLLTSDNDFNHLNDGFLSVEDINL